MKVTVRKKNKKPLHYKLSIPRRIFLTVNTLLLLSLALLCAFPFLNLLALSFSESNAAGMVTVIPKNFTLNAYTYLINKPQFFSAFWMSIKRAVLGTALALAVMVLAAYPLSLTGERLHGRRVYIAICITSMFFSGGLIPTFMVIKSLGLYNKIWALVLPQAMNCWSMILLINFFRKVPAELKESAKIEGAGHFRILLNIVVPSSTASIATVVLLTAIQHWNSWFDGYIYMSSENYPLQTYIYNLLDTLKALQQNTNKTAEDLELLKTLGDSTLRSAQVFIAIIPIMLVYPMAQKYFIKGLLLGAVKE